MASETPIRPKSAMQRTLQFRLLSSSLTNTISLIATCSVVGWLPNTFSQACGSSIRALVGIENHRDMEVGQRCSFARQA